MNTSIRGFTLLEMLVTVIIIGILAAIAIPSFQKFIYNSRLESLRGDLLANAQILERYYAQNHTFTGVPASLLKQHEYFDIALDATQTTANNFVLVGTPNSSYASSEDRSMRVDSNGVVTVCTPDTSSSSGKSCVMY